MNTHTLTLPAGAGTITDLAWSADGNKVAAVTANGYLHLWSTKHGTHVLHYRLTHAHLLTVAWARHGRALVVGGANGALYRVTRLTQPQITRHSFPAPITRLAWSSSPLDRCLVVAGQRLTILDKRGGEALLEYQAPILDAAWAPDGRTLAVVCQDGLVEVWDADQHRSRFASTAIAGPQCLSWHIQGHRLAIGTANGTIYLYDPQAGALRQAQSLAPFALQTLAWGQGSLVARGAQGTVAFWHEQDHASVSHLVSTSTLVLNPQGTVLASGHQQQVTLTAL